MKIGELKEILQESKEDIELGAVQFDNCIFGYGVCCYPVEDCRNCPNYEAHREEAGQNASEQNG